MKRQSTNPVADTVPSSGAGAAPSESGPELACADATPATGSGPSLSTEAGSSSECLTDDEVVAFLAGGISNRLLQRVDGHIDGCSHCFDLVRAATPDAEVMEGSQRFGGLALRVGSLVGGRYRIRRFVDRGGMGEVYEALDLKLNERVALKTVLCSVGDSAHAVRKLFAEVQLARRIAHRHVCRIYELHEHPDPNAEGGPVHFLTMEFIDGEKLSKHLAGGPLPLAEAQAIARQLLLGLDAAHEAGVLHLDFKSDNVMLRAGSAAPDAIVMDFGLARALDTQSRLRTSELKQIAGSVAYMAPEQVECQPVLGEAADIYAFGVVLFEMLTGHLPFEGQSPAAVMLKRLKYPPPVPSSLRAEIPKALDEFVLGCLSRDPRRRYSDASQALAALDAISLAPSPPRRAGALIARVAAVALAVVLGSAIALVIPRGAPSAETSVARQPLEPAGSKGAPGSGVSGAHAAEAPPTEAAALGAGGLGAGAHGAGVLGTGALGGPAPQTPSPQTSALEAPAGGVRATERPSGELGTPVVVAVSSEAELGKPLAADLAGDGVVPAAAGVERARPGGARRGAGKGGDAAQRSAARAHDPASASLAASVGSATRAVDSDARRPAAPDARQPALGDASQPAAGDGSPLAPKKPGLPGAPPRLR
jgi:protein kinase-like protein